MTVKPSLYICIPNIYYPILTHFSNSFFDLVIEHCDFLIYLFCYFGFDSFLTIIGRRKQPRIPRDNYCRMIISNTDYLSINLLYIKHYLIDSIPHIVKHIL